MPAWWAAGAGCTPTRVFLGSSCPADLQTLCATGKPVWGTLIALLHEGRPVLGTWAAAAASDGRCSAVASISHLDLHSTVAGKPVWGTLIALLHDGQPVLGVIDQPITKERWVGVAGKPSTLNGAVIQISTSTGSRRHVLHPHCHYGCVNVQIAARLNAAGGPPTSASFLSHDSQLPTCVKLQAGPS